jgi:hypothetical protein
VGAANRFYYGLLPGVLLGAGCRNPLFHVSFRWYIVKLVNAKWASAKNGANADWLKIHEANLAMGIKRNTFINTLIYKTYSQ